MKKVIFLIVIIVVVVILGGAVYLGYIKPLSGGVKDRATDVIEIEKNSMGKENTPSIDAKYITHNPINVSQIERISKFRSCAGHDFSGRNFAGQIEKNSSMKHYAKPLAEFSGGAEFYAPFDGSVYIDNTHPGFGEGERGDSLEFISPLESNAVVILAHINVLPKFKQHGIAVKAGELVGRSVTSGGSDFDLALRALNQPNSPSRFGNTFDSVFNHMTPEVLAEYEQVGLRRDTMLISWEYRKENPCVFGGGNKIEDNWVYLHQI